MAAMRDVKLDNMCKIYKDIFHLNLRDETTGLFMGLDSKYTEHIDSFEEAFNYYTSIYMEDEEEKLTNLDKRFSSLTFFITYGSKLGKMTSKSLIKKFLSRYPLNIEYFDFS